MKLALELFRDIKKFFIAEEPNAFGKIWVYRTGLPQPLSRHVQACKTALTSGETAVQKSIFVTLSHYWLLSYYKYAMYAASALDQTVVFASPFNL